jgi:hypothetical protein
VLLLTTPHRSHEMGEMVDGETVTTYVTPELAYLVRVERSQAKVGGQAYVLGPDRSDSYSATTT